MFRIFNYLYISLTQKRISVNKPDFKLMTEALSLKFKSIAGVACYDYNVHKQNYVSGRQWFNRITKGV